VSALQDSSADGMILVIAPGFDGPRASGRLRKILLVKAYMDPASAQGSILMLGIGCSHISGLLLG
jgi:hypothetical protein